jgi:hypothetical protein
MWVRVVEGSEDTAEARLPAFVPSSEKAVEDSLLVPVRGQQTQIFANYINNFCMSGTHKRSKQDQRPVLQDFSTFLSVSV